MAAEGFLSAVHRRLIGIASAVKKRIRPKKPGVASSVSSGTVPSLTQSDIEEIRRTIASSVSQWRVEPSSARKPFHNNLFRSLFDRANGFILGRRRRTPKDDEFAVRRYHHTLDHHSKLIVRAVDTRHAAATAVASEVGRTFEGMKKGQTAVAIEKATYLKAKLEAAEKNLYELPLPKTLKQAEHDYLQWRAKLKRPPYSQKFVHLTEGRHREQIAPLKVGLKDRHEPEAKVQQPPDREKTLDEYIKLIKKYGPYSIYLGLPAEIVFTLPAFQFLVLNQWHEAVAGAVIFTGLLYCLGIALGVLIWRSREWAPPAGGPLIDTSSDQPPPLPATTARGAWSEDQREATPPERPRTNWFYVACAIVVGLTAIGTVALGASLRAMVPKITELDAQLDRKAKQASQELRQGDQDNALDAARPTSAAPVSEKTDEEKLRDQLFKNIFLFVETIDGWLAALIYFGVVILVALRQYLSLDPVKPYELAASEYAKELSQFDEEKVLRGTLIDQIRVEKWSADELVSRLEGGDYTVDRRLFELQEQSLALSEIIASLNSLKTEQDANRRSLINDRMTRFITYYVMAAPQLTDKERQDLRHHLSVVWQTPVPDSFKASLDRLTATASRYKDAAE